MALVAQFVSQYDASNRAQFVSQYAEDVQTTTLFTEFDSGNVDPDLSSVTGADTLTPTIFLDRRPETDADWKHIRVRVDGASGKTITFQINRETMQDPGAAPTVGCIPFIATDLSDLSTYTQAASRTLSGISPNRIISCEFTIPSGTNTIYFTTHPFPPNSYAATFVNELLTDYPSIASVTRPGGVYNVSPSEINESGRQVGLNNQYAVKLEFGGSTSDGARKRKLVMNAGTHAAGEHLSWVAFEAFMREALDGVSAAAVNIRSDFDIYLNFNINPNGIVAGCRRGFTTARATGDPNRDWVAQIYPEIAASAAAILEDTEGTADAFITWHTWADKDSLFVIAAPGPTSSEPFNAQTAAFIANLDTVSGVTSDKEYSTVNTTDVAWARDNLGCTVSIASEMGMRAPTAISGVQNVGVKWLEALALTNEQGLFIDGEVFPTAAASVSAAYDPVVSTDGVTVTPTAAASASLAYDPVVATNVIVLPTLAQSVSLAYEPRVRAGRIPPTQRIIIQGVYSTRSVIQGRYQR